jgi:hypothetical protein
LVAAVCRGLDPGGERLGIDGVVEPDLAAEDHLPLPFERRLLGDGDLLDEELISVGDGDEGPFLGLETHFLKTLTGLGS